MRLIGGFVAIFTRQFSLRVLLRPVRFLNVDRHLRSANGQVEWLIFGWSAVYRLCRLRREGMCEEIAAARVIREALDLARCRFAKHAAGPAVVVNVVERWKGITGAAILKPPN